MKKVKILIGILIAIVLITSFLICYILRYPLFSYEKNYFEKIGIKGGCSYRNVIANKGEPLRKEVNDNFFIIHYDGLKLGFVEKNANIKDNPSDVMSYADITGKQYRFGRQNIGVGSTRKEVESVYKHIRKITGMQKNRFGVIDKGKWVKYTFNDENLVSEITILVGGGP